ncbi:MAG: hypothetical protein HQK89_06055 [Nitrospirae bacterium]|nr:hypothetical protein [Nitrospirota bacterium]
MSKTVVISIEADRVKVVVAKKSGRTVKVVDYFTMDAGELDEFLEKDESREYVVVSEFIQYHQDSVYIPNVKPKYCEDMIRNEVRRLHPELEAFSLVYFDLGEKVEGRKTVEEYYTLSFAKSEVDNIISKFIDKKKKVKAIYADFLVPINFMAAIEATKALDEPYLLVFAAGNNKVTLLMQSNRLLFARSSQALNYGTSEFDLQSISMTLSHCHQTLRINPAFVTIAGTMTTDFDVETIPPFQVAGIIKPRFCEMDDIAFTEYFLGVSALCVELRKKDGIKMDVTASDYRTFLLLARYLTYSSLAFIVLSLMTLAYIGKTAMEVSGLRGQIAGLRASNTDLQSISDRFNAIKTPILAKTKLIDALHRHKDEAWPSDLLIPLSEVETKNLNIESLNWDKPAGKKSKGAVFTIGGHVEAIQSYAEKEAVMGELQNSLKQIKGIKNMHYDLNIRDNSFRLVFEFIKPPGLSENAYPSEEKKK